MMENPIIDNNFIDTIDKNELKGFINNIFK